MWTLFSKSAYCEWKYNDTFESYSGGNIKYTFFQIHMTINAHFPPCIFFETFVNFFDELF